MGFCECGCGKECKRRFVSGHNRRKPKIKSLLCECGCKKFANPRRRFLSGHNLKGKHLSEEHKKKVSHSLRLLKRTLTDGHKKRISEVHSGKIVSLETRAKLRETHKGQKAWNKGLTKTEDHRVLKNTKSIEKGYQNGRKCWNNGLRKETDKRLQIASEKQSKSAVKRMSNLQALGRSWGREGYFFSNKNNKSVYYRSSYELKAFELLENDNSVVQYKVEPFSIPYFIDGMKRNTIPDLLIFYRNKSCRVVEIKPKNMLDLPITIFKVFALRRFCKSKGYLFSVWTEDYLFKSETEQECKGAK